MGEPQAPPMSWVVACFCMVCRTLCCFLDVSDSRLEEESWEGKVKRVEQGLREEEDMVKIHTYTKKFKEVKKGTLTAHSGT